MTKTPSMKLPVKLARLRHGVTVDGRKLKNNDKPLIRLPHLIDKSANLDTTVTACCGLEFAAGVLVEVPWLNLFPHSGCVRASPIPRARLEQYYSDTERAERQQEKMSVAHEVGIPEEVDQPLADAGILTARVLIESRRGWVAKDGEFPEWTYQPSFNGEPIDHGFGSRCGDIGMEKLSVDLVSVDVLRIETCGVRQGCADHRQRCDFLPVTADDATAAAMLDSHEAWARAIDLQHLAWCLVFGPCSKTRLDDRLY